MALGATIVARSAPPLLSTSAAVARGCSPPRSTVLAHAGQARLWRTGDLIGACQARDREFHLGLRFNPRDDLGGCIGETISLPRLSPRYAAWYDDYECDDVYAATIKRRDLRSGRLLTVPTGHARCPPGCPQVGVGPAVRLLLGRRGVMAWIALASASSPASYEVWELDRAGARRLAASDGVDPRYLRLTRHIVRWRESGHIQTARLVG